MDKKNLVKQYLLISDYFQKPFPYDLYQTLGFNKKNIPQNYFVQNGYILNKRTKISNAEEALNLYKKETKRKLRIAKIYLLLLYFFPFVYMIGISGSIAMKTAIEDDDIDVFIICDKHCMWLTRNLDFLIYTLLGRRRTNILKNNTVQNKLCINKYITEQNLKIKTKDIFTALQIFSLKPIYGKNLYHKMLQENNWIYKHSNTTLTNNFQPDLIFILKKIFTFLFLPALWICNLISKFIQVKILEKNHESSYYFSSQTIETYPRTLKKDIQNYLKIN